MFSLKETIFSLFDDYDKINDTYKETDPERLGRGILERFNLLMGEDFDQSLLPYIHNLNRNVMDVGSMEYKFIPYIENLLGDPLIMLNTESMRRRVVKFITQIYKKKGTQDSYRALLYMLGFDTVEFTQHHDFHGFDSPKTFDDEIRTFDNAASLVSEYTLVLTGTLSLTVELIKAIKAVVYFCDPIHAKLREIIYNGEVLLDEVIYIYIDENGDLVYDNTLIPNTGFVLTDGDLIVTGLNTDDYTIVNGNIIYTP